MIVDDDNFNLIALKKILDRICFNTEIISYQDGLEALVYLKNEIEENLDQQS